MQIAEIYGSVEGEGKYTGIPAMFVRVAGCNLACQYCDTADIRDKDVGTAMSVNDIIAFLKAFKYNTIVLTGGEPTLYYKEITEMVEILSKDHTIILHTNGSVCNLDNIVNQCNVSLDVKLLNSGHLTTKNEFVVSNLKLLTEKDEVKFVITDLKDVITAINFIETHGNFRPEYSFQVAWTEDRHQMRRNVQMLSWLLSRYTNTKYKMRISVQQHKLLGIDNIAIGGVF